MTEKQRRKAFWDDVRALEQKHGYRLQAYSLPPKFHLDPIVKPVSQDLIDMAEKLSGNKRPWWKLTA